MTIHSRRPSVLLLALAFAGACSDVSNPTSAARIDRSSPLLLSETGSGGGGSSGGGGGGGGSGSSVSTSAGPCVSIVTFNATAGYRPSSNGTIGAVWTNFTIQSCGSAPLSVSPQLREVEQATGTLAWLSSYPGALSPGQQLSEGTFDNDLAKLATSYIVTLTVTDNSTGVVLAQRSTTVSTPGLKSGA